MSEYAGWALKTYGEIHQKHFHQNREALIAQIESRFSFVWKEMEKYGNQIVKVKLVEVGDEMKSDCCGAKVEKMVSEMPDSGFRMIEYVGYRCEKCGESCTPIEPKSVSKP